MENKYLKKPLSRWLVLLYSFVIIFLPLGLYTLLAGPSKWVIEAALKNGWSEDYEKTIQKLVILLLVVVTLILAALFRKFILGKSAAFLRISAVTLLTITFLTSLYFFTFEPDVLIKLGGDSSEISLESHVGDSGQFIEFVIGPYPDLKDLRRIKETGYVGVVSLLHELVVPAELNLIKLEEKNAKKVGIPIIRIPMLPWVSGNTESIEKIHKLVKEGKGKYFVHCYLGRDRVNVFHKIVDDAGAKSVPLQQKKLRHIDDLPSFERGNYFKISPEIYLVPLPTDEEFFGYIVNGQFASVISLLDPKNPEDTTWISKEKIILERYGVNYINLPVPNVNDKKAMKVLFDSLPHITKPLIIHKYNSTDPIYDQLKNNIKVVKN